VELLHLQAAHKDDRGEIADLIQHENVNAITLITFTKGAVRGNHCHKETVQWNYVISGKIKLVTQMPGSDIVETILNVGDLAVTREHESHALQGLEASSLMVFTRGPRGGDAYELDTFRLEKPLIK